MFFSGRDWESSQDRDKAKNREILDENLLQSAQDLRLGQGSPSNRTLTLSTQPRQCRNDFGRRLKVLELPSQSPDLNLIGTSLERPENGCAAMIPIQPDKA
jgi:hypothetical protein